MIRPKKTLTTNKTFKLLRPRPSSFGCTPKKPVRHFIPNWGCCGGVKDYIAAFSGLNNLRPSEFTLGGEVIRA